MVACAQPRHLLLRERVPQRDTRILNIAPASRAGRIRSPDIGPCEAAACQVAAVAWLLQAQVVPP
jgi:hypothetical protein